MSDEIPDDDEVEAGEEAEVELEPGRFSIADFIGGRHVVDIAKDLEVSARTVQRWIVNGVTWDQADRFAVRVLGTNPVSIWGPDWEAAADEATLGDAQPTLFDDVIGLVADAWRDHSNR